MFTDTKNRNLNRKAGNRTEKFLPESCTDGIRICRLNKSYPGAPGGETRCVLKDLDLFFPYGGKFCIMGESGSGKTTLLRILLNLETADSGSVSGLPEKISVVFQEDRLCEDFSVLTNVLLPFDHMPADEELRLKQKAERLLTQVGLTGEHSGKVKLLSGGMKRRVSIVRALMPESELLILDEPLKGLDEKNRNTCLEVLRSYEGTVLMVTHDAKEAQLLGARIIPLP